MITTSRSRKFGIVERTPRLSRTSNPEQYTIEIPLCGASMLAQVRMFVADREGILSRRAPRAYDADVMRSCSGKHTVQSRALRSVLARLGHIHWFFGNLYEATVDMPQLLIDARSNRPPTLLGAGSPLRYYLPAVPITLTTTAATLLDGWRSGGDKRVIVATATSTASAMALTAHLVRTVNLRLLRSDGPLSTAQTRTLVRTWQRANLARLLCLAVAMWGLRQHGIAEEMATRTPTNRE